MIKVILEEDYKKCYDLIIESFLMTTIKLDISKENCPGYSAFMTYPYFLQQVKNMSLYGLYNDSLLACIGLEKKSDRRYKIKYLCVSPSHQHLGYGKELMLFAETQASSKLQLGMIYENTSLLEWYKSLGYKIDKIKTYKGNTYHIAFMEKIIEERI